MSVETLRRAVEAMREDSDERWHAVADWLEVVADGAEELGIRTLPRDRASAVARAYLTPAAATDDTPGRGQVSRERHPWGADGRPIDWPEPTPLDAIAKRNDSGNDCGEEWCCTACQGSGWADMDPCSDCYGTGHAHSQRRRTHLPVTRRNQ